ncbi:ribonuclease T2 family protein [Legionella saoudiensis]|uniref:ribonuclease T2 family protein n=1 Tax=Legionella saoudiensis TaxID=1750561 RepID=UPI00073117AE|nr:ribonuclease T [Legionella saoudiensis]
MIKSGVFCLFFVSLSVNASGGCDMNAGLSDSNVLALSSQPGFCQTYGYEAGKPECTHLSKESYQARHLTLHGLWPNQNACGQSYGFCGVTQRNNHCDYAPLDLSNVVAENLQTMMPSYKYGSCLERHEWNKHGSCQALTADEYFSLAMRLAKEMDQSRFGSYISENTGKTVSLVSLRRMLDESLGSKNSGKVYLGCKRGVLVDIYIELPALIPADESLEFLIDKAPNYHYHDSCPANVKISDFTKGTILSLTGEKRINVG